MAAVTSRQPVVTDDDDDERSDAGFNSIWGSDVESEPDQSEFEDLPSLPGPSTHRVRHVEPVMTGAWPPEDGGGRVSLRAFSRIYLQLMAFARCTIANLSHHQTHNSILHTHDVPFPNRKPLMPCALWVFALGWAMAVRCTGAENSIGLRCRTKAFKRGQDLRYLLRSMR
jgi:hypothetical protein